MSDFTLVFSGLMCHARINVTTRAAVFVRHTNHRPLIWARQDDYRGGDFDPDQTHNEWLTFKMKPDASIEFHDIVTGQVPLQLPHPQVPHISEIVQNFEPPDEIKILRPHRSVAAYIGFSAGTFSLGCSYEAAATFENDGNYACR